MDIKQLKSAWRESMGTLTENFASHKQAEKFKRLQNEAPKEIEKFADLLDIAFTNLKEAKREYELGNGIFYPNLLRKLSERMVTQYHRWTFEHKKDENVETFRKFIIQEAQFQMAPSETVHVLDLKKENYKSKRGYSYFGTEEQEKKRIGKDALFVV